MFKVETLTAFGGWVDAEWEEDGKPQRFETEAQAQTAIDQLIADVAEAVKRGDMADPYRREDYRTVSA